MLAGNTQLIAPFWLVELCLLFDLGHLLCAGSRAILKAKAEAPFLSTEPPPPFVLILSSDPIRET